MIEIRRTFNRDRGFKLVETLNGYIFTPETNAHTFFIECVDKVNGLETVVPFEAGSTVSARFLKTDQVTELVEGSLNTDGAAVVTLPSECYSVPGRFLLTILVTTGSTTICVYAATGTVIAADSSTVNVSENASREIDEKIAELNAAAAQVSSAISAGSAKITEINQAAAAARASIPQDYTALSDSVGDLKSASESFLHEPVGLNWSLGSYDSGTGIRNTGVTTRICTDYFDPAGDGYLYVSTTDAENVAFWVNLYSSVNAFDSNVKRNNSNPYSGYNAGKRYTITARYTDDREITDVSELADLIMVRTRSVAEGNLDAHLMQRAKTLDEITESTRNIFGGAYIFGYIENSKITIVTGGQAVLVYAPCKGNTVYTVSKAAGTRFSVGTTEEIPVNGVAVSNYISGNSASSLTITTSESAKYIVAYVYNAATDTGTTIENMLATVQIEVGSSATEYIQHMSAIDSIARDTKISKPATSPNGTRGQLLQTNGDGTTTWTAVGLPTDAQTAQAVSDWLNDHPTVITAYVTPEMFGASGNGVDDDASAIQAAINYAHANSCAFMGSGAVYAVGSPIKLVMGDTYAHPFMADFNGSTLKAKVSMTEVILVDVTHNSDGTSYEHPGYDTPGKYPRYIRNIIIDGNGLAQYGIHDAFARSMNFSYVKIQDITDTCFKCDTNSIGGGGLFIDNMTLDQNNTNYMGVTGIYVGITDAKISNVKMRNIRTGVVLIKGSTYLYNVHPFLVNQTAIDGSVAFDIRAEQQYFLFCYADTYEIGWKVKYSNLYFMDCHVYWNMKWYPVDGEIPEIFHFDGADESANVSLANKLYITSFNAEVGSYYSATNNTKKVKFSNIASNLAYGGKLYGLKSRMSCNYTALDNLPNPSKAEGFIQTGSISIPFTSGGSTTVDVPVTFDSPFASSPVVMLTPQVNSSKVEYASTGFIVLTKSQTGFTARAIRETATSFTAHVDWVAIG